MSWVLKKDQGPGFCQVVGQAHIYSVLDRHGVAGRANNQSYYFGTWVQVGSWGQQKSSGHVLAMSNQYACGLPVVSILFFVDVSTRGQSGKGDGLPASCMGLSGLGCFSKITRGKVLRHPQ